MNHTPPPPCPCGGTRWRPAGSSGSPYGLTECRQCEACRALALEIWRPGGTLLLHAPSEADHGYIETLLQRIWRARAVALKAWRDARWKARLGPQNLFDLPVEAREALWAAFEAETVAAFGAVPDRAAPPELRDHPQPLRCPEDWAGRAFVLSVETREWAPIDPVACREGALPEDPDRAATFAFFAEVWRLVEAATGLALAGQAEEIPNGYRRDPGRSEPWFRLSLPALAIDLGWRHSVVSLQAAATAPEGIDPRPIAALAAAEGSSLWVDDDWRPDEVPSRARCVAVHAGTAAGVAACLARLVAPATAAP